MQNTELKVAINCPECGTRCEDEVEQLPNPNMAAETAWESSDCVGGTIICSKCGKEIDYSISEDMNGYRTCVPPDLEII